MQKSKSAASDTAYILTGLAVWLLSAVMLLLLSAAIIQLLEAEEASLGYIISAISFLSAAAAGFAAEKRHQKAVIYTALIMGCTVICFALTLGFLAAGKDITADAVLSLVTFTLTGSIAGAMLPGSGVKKKKISFRRKGA